MRMCGRLQTGAGEGRGPLQTCRGQRWGKAEVFFVFSFFSLAAHKNIWDEKPLFVKMVSKISSFFFFFCWRPISSYCGLRKLSGPQPAAVGFKSHLLQS